MAPSVTLAKMKTSDRIERALENLRGRGYEIGSAGVNLDGKMLVAINGQLMTYPDIYELADSQDVRVSFACEATSEGVKLTIYPRPSGTALSLYFGSESERNEAIHSMGLASSVACSDPKAVYGITTWHLRRVAAFRSWAS